MIGTSEGVSPQIERGPEWQGSLADTLDIWPPWPGSPLYCHPSQDFRRFPLFLETTPLFVEHGVSRNDIHSPYRRIAVSVGVALRLCVYAKGLLAVDTPLTV